MSKSIGKRLKLEEGGKFVEMKIFVCAFQLGVIEI
jgi:hypothetical protein